MNDVAILVPSYDGYSDIWPISATLFERFWPDREWPMYWMTNEAKVPSIASPIHVPSIHRDQWGLGIAHALEQISEPLILFWVEEIFALSAVPNNVFLEAADLLRNHHEISIIALTRYYDQPDIATLGSFGYSREGHCSTSALPALFRRDILIHLLRTLPKSNDFEQQSSAILLRDFPAVRTLVPAPPMFRFCDNPLIAGKWRECGLKHVREMNIHVDASQRGIHDDVCSLMDGFPG